MNYQIKEIFTSIQGEGLCSGIPATFIRFAGCNLHCSFCDTDHSNPMEMGEEEIIKHIEEVGLFNILVLTGGEPTMQRLDDLLMAIRKKFGNNLPIAIETNGTDPQRLLWWKHKGFINFITVSPKIPEEATFESLAIANEVKVVLADGVDPEVYAPYMPQVFARQSAFIQPCSENFEPAICFVTEHRKWRLGVQVQKVIKVR